MRALLVTLLLLVAHAAMASVDAPAPAESTRPAVLRFAGDDFLAIDVLLAPELFDGAVELAYWGRNLVIDLADGRRLVIENGGNRLRDAEGRVRALDPPVLVVEGRHYLPVRGIAEAFGFRHAVRDGDLMIQRTTPDADAPVVSWPVQPLLPDRQLFDVRHLTPIEEGWRVATHLRAWSRLARGGEGDVLLEPGTSLLARRTFELDGSMWVLVTENAPTLRTLVLPRASLEAQAEPMALDGTYFDRLKAQALELAEDERGFNHGPREKLPRTVAVTADLCWSLRDIERAWYAALPEAARTRGHDVHVVQFVSGRWLEQYPEAMDWLLQLDDQPGVHFEWALHSHDHPKSGIFMNDYAPESLRGDTLWVETLLLRWGVPPEVYYRFPGLIHDRTRLREIIALNLLPADCDSWIASTSRGRIYWPTRLPPSDGSVILIHGNGNEPGGIPAIVQFFAERPDWRTAPYHRFFDPDTPIPGPPEDLEVGDEWMR